MFWSFPVERDVAWDRVTVAKLGEFAASARRPAGPAGGCGRNAYQFPGAGRGDSDPADIERVTCWFRCLSPISMDDGRGMASG
ncbi:MAG: hypothetical protein ACRDPA_18515, partial [Solirubrobacteraceae bacterium]